MIKVAPIKVIPCERSHLESMKGRTVDKILAEPRSLNASVSLVKNDNIIIGAGGFAYVDEDHYCAWTVLTHDCVKNHKVTLHKIATGFVEEVAPKLGIKKVTAYIVDGFDAGIRWATVLGFEYEEHVPCGTQGAQRDYVKMRRLWVQ